MSFNLIELLTNTIVINIDNNKAIKHSQDFIMQLIKDLKPKKAIDLLKELQLSKEDIKKLITKLPKKEQQIYLELLKNLEDKSPISKNLKPTSSNSKNPKIPPNLKKPKTDLPIFEDSKGINKTKIKLQKSNLNSFSNNSTIKKNQNEKELKNIKESKTENIKVENILHLFINKTPNLNISNSKIENSKQIKFKLIKKKIEINLKKNQNLESQKIIDQIKNASSIEKLINIANKNDLNAKKIILKTINQNIIPNQKTASIQINSVKNTKIAINSKLKNIKVKTNYSKNKSSNFIQTILKQKISKQQDINKNENSINTINTNISIIKSNENEKHSKILSKNKRKNKIDERYILNSTNIHTEIKQKIITAKETIKHFSKNLKETIENYKPPISKLSIELHPKDLGKVDITIIQRGDNLQVNVNSNSNVISFFHLNQTELKNSLINLGFNGIDMNFNSNQNSNQKHQKRKNSNPYTITKKEKEYNELIIEIPYKYA